jgi:hypothetical protein
VDTFESLRRIRDASPDDFSKFDLGEILIAEHNLGIVFPDSLKNLWEEFGYFAVLKGLKNEEETNQFNRLLAPSEIEGLVNGIDVGFSSPQDERIDGAVPIMAYSESGCIQMKLDDTGVFYFDELVAKRLEEFIDKLSIDADFYRV